MKIACIVEGHGEVEAVPVLLRRIASQVAANVPVEVLKPIRIPRDRLLKPEELERAVGLACRKLGGKGSVLILLDAEDDCPATLAPKLNARARRSARGIPVGVVLAKFEYESWFLAAAESIRGMRGLALDLSAPPEPETIRGAKEWLTTRKIDGTAYSPTVDQAALSAIFNLASARRADSFDKCYRTVVGMLRPAQSEP